MRVILILTLIFTGFSFCSAQQKKSTKTAVFKVRAPKAACSVFTSDSVFWLERPATIRVKVRSDKQTKVVFGNGKIIAQEDDLYTVRFDTSGTTVIAVFEIDGKRKKLIHTSRYKVKEPEVYFCGVKVGTRSNYLMMRGEHLKAYSIPLDTMLKVKGFDMMFHDGIKYKTYHADNNMLSKEMHKVIFEDFRFPAKGKQLFFANIKAEMPDGKLKTLNPISIYVQRDSTNRDEVVFNFEVRRTQLKKADE